MQAKLIALQKNFSHTRMPAQLTTLHMNFSHIPMPSCTVDRSAEEFLTYSYAVMHS